MMTTDAGPLQASDDLLGHQTSMRMAPPVVADSKHAFFTERYWYMGTTVPDGAFVFGAGLEYYPNRGVLDSHAGITLDGV
jgi:hypothetical protein